MGKQNFLPAYSFHFSSMGMDNPNQACLKIAFKLHVRDTQIHLVNEHWPPLE